MGELFKRTVKEKIKTELLIFITPHVAKKASDLKNMSKDEQKGMKTVDESAGGGQLLEHLDGLKRGANPDASIPEGEKKIEQNP